MARLAWHRPNWRRPGQRIVPLTWPFSGWRHGESNPGPPACKLAAESPSAVAEHVRGASGRSDAQLVLGSLPYFSGVRTRRTTLRDRSHTWWLGRGGRVQPAVAASFDGLALHPCVLV